MTQVLLVVVNSGKIRAKLYDGSKIGPVQVWTFSSEQSFLKKPTIVVCLEDARTYKINQAQAQRDFRKEQKCWRRKRARR